MPTVITIEEIITDIQIDPLRSTISTYLKHLSADEIDNYFLKFGKDNRLLQIGGLRRLFPSFAEYVK